MRPIPRLLLTLSVLAASAGCSTRLGSVSDRVIELYDLGTADGVIEIELYRNGNLLELEATVAVTDVPMAIREAAIAHLTGATVTGAEREFGQWGDGWEIQLQHEGRAWELLYDEDAKLIETEQELTVEESPSMILANAASAVLPGAARTSIGKVTRGDRVQYHVKFVHREVSYKVVTDVEGNVVRAVREARAQIEIPLK